MMSVSATDQGCGLINTAPSNEPNIPAIIFSIIRIGDWWIVPFSIGTNYLSAFTSEYVSAPALTTKAMTSPTKIISI